MVLEAINDASKLISLLEDRGFPLKLSPENIDREFLKKESRQWLSNLFYEFEEYWPTIKEMEQYRQLEAMNCFEGFLDDDPEELDNDLQIIQNLSNDIQSLNDLIDKNKNYSILTEKKNSPPFSSAHEHHHDKEEEMQNHNHNQNSSTLQDRKRKGSIEAIPSFDQSKWTILDTAIRQLKGKDEKLVQFINESKCHLEELKFPKNERKEMDQTASLMELFLPITDDEAIKNEPIEEYYKLCCQILLNKKSFKNIPLEFLLSDQIEISLQRWQYFHDQNKMINDLEERRRATWESIHERLLFLKKDLEDYDEYTREKKIVQYNSRFSTDQLEAIVREGKKLNEIQSLTISNLSFIEKEARPSTMMESLDGNDEMLDKSFDVKCKNEWIKQLREYVNIDKKISNALNSLEEKTDQELRELQNNLTFDK